MVWVFIMRCQLLLARKIGAQSWIAPTRNTAPSLLCPHASSASFATRWQSWRASTQGLLGFYIHERRRHMMQERTPITTRGQGVPPYSKSTEPRHGDFASFATLLAHSTSPPPSKFEMTWRSSTNLPLSGPRPSQTLPFRSSSTESPLRPWTCTERSSKQAMSDLIGHVCPVWSCHSSDWTSRRNARLTPDLKWSVAAVARLGRLVH